MNFYYNDISPNFLFFLEQQKYIDSFQSCHLSFGDRCSQSMAFLYLLELKGIFSLRRDRNSSLEMATMPFFLFYLAMFPSPRENPGVLPPFCYILQLYYSTEGLEYCPPKLAAGNALLNVLGDVYYSSKRHFSVLLHRKTSGFSQNKRNSLVSITKVQLWSTISSVWVVAPVVLQM